MLLYRIFQIAFISVATIVMIFEVRDWIVYDTQSRWSYAIPVLIFGMVWLEGYVHRKRLKTKPD